MKKNQETFLDFTETIEETRKHYEDNAVILMLLKKKEKRFFDDQLDYLGKCLIFILSETWVEEEKNMFSWDPEYFLLGHFYEGLLRLILMGELTAEEFFKRCFKPKNSKKTICKKNPEQVNLTYGKYTTLGDLQVDLMKQPKIKSLTKKRQARIRHVLEYVGLQRNKHAHQHPKGTDTYSVRYDIYLLIEVLIKIFGINLSKEANDMLKHKIEFERKNFSGMRYEPVWEDYDNSSH